MIVPASASLVELTGKVHLQFVLHMGDWHTSRFAGLNEAFPECDGGLEGSEVRVIFHTSGSTKDSKGVAVSNSNMMAAYTAVSSYLGDFADAVILNFSPLHFDYGFYNIMMPLLGGGHSVSENALPEQPEHLLDLIQRRGITGMHILPPAIHYLLQADPDTFQPQKNQIPEVHCQQRAGVATQAYTAIASAPSRRCRLLHVWPDGVQASCVFTSRAT